MSMCEISGRRILERDRDVFHQATDREVGDVSDCSVLLWSQHQPPHASLPSVPMAKLRGKYMLQTESVLIKMITVLGKVVMTHNIGT